jgi:hypothetical protein
MSKLVETVSKKPIPPHVKAVIVEICANDTEGEDVEVSSKQNMDMWGKKLMAFLLRCLTSVLRLDSSVALQLGVYACFYFLCVIKAKVT